MKIKNLNYNEKIADLISKGKKLVLKAAPLALAATMAFAPVRAKAEGETPSVPQLVSQKTTSEEGELTAQESASHPMTMEEYTEGVINAYTEISKYFSYDHMMADIQSAYYLVNYEYISDELEAELVENGYITEVDMVDAEGNFTKDNPEGWVNTDNFTSLKNKINKYNQETIHMDYDKKKKNIEHLIDPSVLCFDEHDRENVHNLFVKWFDAYNLKKNSIMSNEAFDEATEHVLGNNAIDGQEDIYEASVGARWLMRKVTGGDLMQFMRDYLDENYRKQHKTKELEKYFQPDKLSESQYFLKEGIDLDYECPDELEYIVVNFGQYWHHILTTVNNDMYSRLTMDELAKDQAAALDGPVLHK